MIVPMTERDVPAVLAVAEASFARPWTRDELEKELARDWAVLRVLRPGQGAPVASFVALWVVRDEIHVLSIATHPAARRRGYARYIMEEVLSLARARHVRWVTLEVRRRNVAALGLYKGLGFAAIGVRPRYYVEDGEDAIVMLLELDPITGRVEPRTDEPL